MKWGSCVKLVYDLVNDLASEFGICDLASEFGI